MQGSGVLAGENGVPGPDEDVTESVQAKQCLRQRLHRTAREARFVHNHVRIGTRTRVGKRASHPPLTPMFSCKMNAKACLSTRTCYTMRPKTLPRPASPPLPLSFAHLPSGTKSRFSSVDSVARPELSLPSDSLAKYRPFPSDPPSAPRPPLPCGTTSPTPPEQPVRRQDTFSTSEVMVTGENTLKRFGK